MSVTSRKTSEQKTTSGKFLRSATVVTSSLCNCLKARLFHVEDVGKESIETAVTSVNTVLLEPSKIKKTKTENTTRLNLARSVVLAALLQ